MLPVDLIVLAGGRGSRLDGALKPAVEVAGRTLLSRVLDARPLAQRAVVVGPPEAQPSAIDADGNAVSVTWALEDPPFGGPVAGLAAGLAALGTERATRQDKERATKQDTERATERDTEQPTQRTAAYEASHAAPQSDPDVVPTATLPLAESADWVLVLACDLPWAAQAARHLQVCTSALISIGEADNVDGLHFIDHHGRPQWLTAIYRTSALRAAVARLGETTVGASMRQLVDGLPLKRLLDESTMSNDVDTWQDVKSSTARLTGAPRDET